MCCVCRGLVLPRLERLVPSFVSWPYVIPRYVVSAFFKKASWRALRCAPLACWFSSVNQTFNLMSSDSWIVTPRSSDRARHFVLPSYLADSWRVVLVGVLLIIYKMVVALVSKWQQLSCIAVIDWIHFRTRTYSLIILWWLLTCAEKLGRSTHRHTSEGYAAKYADRCIRESLVAW